MAVRRRTRSGTRAAAGIAALGLVLGAPGAAGADEIPAAVREAGTGWLVALDQELRALYDRAALLDAGDDAMVALERRIDELLVVKRDELDRRRAVDGMPRAG
jgi:hypothetical protein